MKNKKPTTKLETVLPFPRQPDIREDRRGDEYSDLSNGVSIMFQIWSGTFTISHPHLFTSASFKDMFLVKKLLFILSRKDAAYFTQFRYMQDILQNLENNKEFSQLS